MNLSLLLFSTLFSLFLNLCSEKTATPCGEAPDNMSCIPGGTFIRGADNKRRDQRPAAKIWIDTFFMDKYEVTAGDYEKCVRKGLCIFQRTNYPHYSGEEQPKVGESWFAANHYCKVHGKRLPTESEWEKAARGPNGDIYPWGNTPVSCKNAVIKSKAGRGCGRKGFKPGKGRTWNVGSKPVGRYGLYDMIGNADEYVNDWYSESYALCGKACFGDNPKGPCGGKFNCPGHKERVVRGGSWYWGPSHGYGSYRRAHFPKQHPVYHHFGFRCAKDSFTPIDLFIIIINSLHKTISLNLGSS